MIRRTLARLIAGGDRVPVPYSPPPVHERSAVVTKVVDGDTLHILADLGCDVTGFAMTVRLIGLDAPEMSTLEGKAAKAYVEHWVAQHGPSFILRTERDRREKFGRWLVDLLPVDGSDSLCKSLIVFGYAVPYNGGAR